jgi:serine/threonine-protein kinase PknG
VGRTLAVLLTDVRGFSSDHRYTLPTPQEEPKFAGQESLYRFLLKMTAKNPDDRFVSAEEAAEQLLGVLREVVAVETTTPHPGSSSSFGPDLLALDSGNEMRPAEPEYAHLPLPSIDIEDPAAQAVSGANALAEPARRVAALELVRGRYPKSREARLRLAAAQSDHGDFSDAEEFLKQLGEEDAWDWRVLWFQGRMRLAQHKPTEARKLFDQVYFDLPGELAPKLALALSAELDGDLKVASAMYDRVSQTDPGFVSAVFGLARCRFRAGDRTGAVAALNRIPPSSGLFLRSRVEAARMLVRPEASAPRLEDLASASALAESLALGELNKLLLGNQILTAAVEHISSKALSAGQHAKDLKIMGHAVSERQLRLGLESSLRGLARFMSGDERIQLVDQANLMRPSTLI